MAKPFFYVESQPSSTITQKRKRPISSHLDLLDLVRKGFQYYMDNDRHFSCGIQRAIPSGQDRTNLPGWLANRSTGFGSSFLLADLRSFSYCTLLWYFHLQLRTGSHSIKTLEMSHPNRPRPTRSCQPSNSHLATSRVR